jgi:hypothetical protein
MEEPEEEAEVWLKMSIAEEVAEDTAAPDNELQEKFDAL